MQTEKLIFPWGTLFDKNGKPLPDFHLTMDEIKVPFLVACELEEPPHRSANSLLFWNNETADTIHKTSKSTKKILSTKAQKVNGHAHEYLYAGIKLPEKNPQIIWEKLLLYFGREKRRDPFGEWLWQQVQNKNYSIHSLSNMLSNIQFHLVYVQDPETGKLKQLELPIRKEDTGIYFIKEHAPELPYSEIVYVGKSFNSMRTTVWCHFHNWKGKNYKGYNNRGEDRGKWIEKISKGYSYSIGTLKILPAQEGFPGMLQNQIYALERIFIHLLDPRDNDKEKLIIAPGANQGALFENLDSVSADLNSNTIEEAPSSTITTTGDDDVPF